MFNNHYRCNFQLTYICCTGLEWFNVSEGLSLAQHLKGKIILLDFFTYCCINCMHVLAELEEVEKEVSVEDGLVVVSVTFYCEKGQEINKIISGD